MQTTELIRNGSNNIKCLEKNIKENLTNISYVVDSLRSFIDSSREQEDPCKDIEIKLERFFPKNGTSEGEKEAVDDIKNNEKAKRIKKGREFMQNLSKIMLMLLEQILLLVHEADIHNDKRELEQKDIISTEARKKNEKKNPIPPIGLLSLRNYTDIACLLEYFLVTVSFLLEDLYFAYPIKIRISEMLPKTLRGRMYPGVKHLCHYFSSLIDNTVESDYNLEKKNIDIEHKKRKRSVQKLEMLHRSISVMSKIIIESHRFKPFLLQRHLSDLYALIFLYNNTLFILRQKNCTKQEEEKSVIFKYGKIQIESNYFVPNIDGVSVAKALQSLLYSHKTSPSSGRLLKSQSRPLWMIRVCKYWLNRLSILDLSSVIFVFVHSAKHIPGLTIQTSSKHMASALVTSSPIHSKPLEKTGSKNICSINQRIWDQLLKYLDEISFNVGTNNDSIQNDRQDFIHSAVFVLVDVLTLASDKTKYINQLLYDTRNNSDQKQGNIPKKNLERIKNYMSFLIMSETPVMYSALEELLKQNVLGSILQSCCNSGTYSLGGKIQSVGDECEELAVENIQILLRGYILAGADRKAGFSESSRCKNDVVKKAAMYLIRSIITSLNTDMLHSHLQTGRSDIGTSDNLQDSMEDFEDTNILNPMLLQIEQRCKVLSQVIKQIMSIPGQEEGDKSDQGGDTGLLGSRVFQLLLTLCYYSPEHIIPESIETKEEAVLIPSKALQFAAMAFLPIISEECGISNFFISSSSNSYQPIFNTIGWVLYIGAREFGNNKGRLDTEKDQETIKFSIADNIQGWNIEYDDAISTKVIDTILEAIPTHHMSKVSLQSTACVCLGILIAILELGESFREPMEEKIILSFLPMLHQLSSPFITESVSTSPINDDFDEKKALIAASSEMAEMSAHAAILIISRSSIQQPNKSLRKKSTEGDECGYYDDESHDNKQSKIFQKKIKQIEADLKSEMVPLRARGVKVILHLARSITTNHDKSILDSRGLKEKVQLISEVNQETSIGPSRDLLVSDAIQKINQLLALAVSALNDEDSYVYIAAIQAISSLADTNPSHVLPILTKGLCQGVIVNTNNRSTQLDNRHDEVESINLAQRVKIAEALMFAIRRRGRGISLYSKGMIEQLLLTCKFFNSAVGEKKKHNIIGQGKTAVQIQKNTHAYFMKGAIPTTSLSTFEYQENNTDETNETLSEEKQIRVNTGGPIFEIEESYLIGSSCLNCVTEIVRVLPGRMLRTHCGKIINICINALRLDHSRPLRRAAALLSGELYRYLVSEENNNNDVNEPGISLSFDGEGSDAFLVAVEMILCDEDILFSELKQCASLIQHNSILYDPSVEARCKEALYARNICDETGLLTAASLCAADKSRQKLYNENVPMILQNMLK